MKPVNSEKEKFREVFRFFGSRQLMVAKMNGRAGAKTNTHDSGELLSSADAP